jgi:hypothetical protein
MKEACDVSVVFNIAHSIWYRHIMKPDTFGLKVGQVLIELLSLFDKTHIVDLILNHRTNCLPWLMQITANSRPTVLYVVELLQAVLSHAAGSVQRIDILKGFVTKEHRQNLFKWLNESKSSNAKVSVRICQIIDLLICHHTHLIVFPELGELTVQMIVAHQHDCKLVPILRTLPLCLYSLRSTKAPIEDIRKKLDTLYDFLVAHQPDKYKEPTVADQHRDNSLQAINHNRQSCEFCSMSVSVELYCDVVASMSTFDNLVHSQALLSLIALLQQCVNQQDIADIVNVCHTLRKILKQVPKKYLNDPKRMLDVAEILKASPLMPMLFEVLIQHGIDNEWLTEHVCVLMSAVFEIVSEAGLKIDEQESLTTFQVCKHFIHAMKVYADNEYLFEAVCKLLLHYITKFTGGVLINDGMREELDQTNWWRPLIESLSKYYENDEAVLMPALQLLSHCTNTMPLNDFEFLTDQVLVKVIRCFRDKKLYIVSSAMRVATKWCEIDPRKFNGLLMELMRYCLKNVSTSSNWESRKAMECFDVLSDWFSEMVKKQTERKQGFEELIGHYVQIAMQYLQYPLDMVLNACNVLNSVVASGNVQHEIDESMLMCTVMTIVRNCQSQLINDETCMSEAYRVLQLLSSLCSRYETCRLLLQQDETCFADVIVEMLESCAQTAPAHIKRNAEDSRMDVATAILPLLSVLDRVDVLKSHLDTLVPGILQRCSTNRPPYDIAQYKQDLALLQMYLERNCKGRAIEGRCRDYLVHCLSIFGKESVEICRIVLGMFDKYIHFEVVDIQEMPCIRKVIHTVFQDMLCILHEHSHETDIVRHSGAIMNKMLFKSAVHFQVQSEILTFEQLSSFYNLLMTYKDDAAVLIELLPVYHQFVLCWLDAPSNEKETALQTLMQNTLTGLLQIFQEFSSALSSKGSTSKAERVTVVVLGCQLWRTITAKQQIVVDVQLVFVQFTELLVAYHAENQEAMIQFFLEYLQKNSQTLDTDGLVDASWFTSLLTTIPRCLNLYQHNPSIVLPAVQLLLKLLNSVVMKCLNDGSPSHQSLLVSVADRHELLRTLLKRFLKEADPKTGSSVALDICIAIVLMLQSLLQPEVKHASSECSEYLQTLLTEIGEYRKEIENIHAIVLTTIDKQIGNSTFGSAISAPLESAASTASQASAADAVAVMPPISAAVLDISPSEIDIAEPIDSNVFKAMWRKSQVVLKLPEQNNSMHMVGDDMDCAELQILSKLRHNRLISVLGCCSSLESLFLTTTSQVSASASTETVSACSSGYLLEYMEQGDLRSVLDRERTMPFLKKLQIACDVCEAMQFLHNSSLIHRDLKSRNVLIDRHGRAKVSGFGVREKKMREAPLKYAFNSGNVSVDVYDFGVLLWELETGKVPWEDRTSKQLRLTLNAKEAKVCDADMMKLMTACMKSDATLSLSFDDIMLTLQTLLEKETKRLETKRKAIPDGFICPITQDVMKDPVILMHDGHSYERKSILDWLERAGRSPLTNEVIRKKGGASGNWDAHLFANYALKSAIESFLSNLEL